MRADLIVKARLLRQKITDLPLSERAIHGLTNENIVFVGETVQLEKAYLSSLPNVGRITTTEIEKELKLFGGFFLGMNIGGGWWFEKTDCQLVEFLEPYFQVFETSSSPPPLTASWTRTQPGRGPSLSLLQVQMPPRRIR